MDIEEPDETIALPSDSASGTFNICMTLLQRPCLFSYYNYNFHYSKKPKLNYYASKGSVELFKN